MVDLFMEMAEAIRIKEPRIVPLEMSDGSKPQFAIQLTDGSFHGQKWNEIHCQHCNGVAQSTRTYPTWKTQKSAQKELDKLNAENNKLSDR